MSIGEYVPSVGEQFIFLGIKEDDGPFGPWNIGGENEGKVIKVVAVGSTSNKYRYEIALLDYEGEGEEFDVDDNDDPIPAHKTFATKGSELGFLQVKPLEHWE